jgi:hypothetical protein
MQPLVSWTPENRRKRFIDVLLRVVAKKAYLNTLLSPPAALLSPTSTTRIQIKPYDGPEAQSIIQAVQQRAHVRHFTHLSMIRSDISLPQ